MRDTGKRRENENDGEKKGKKGRRGKGMWNEGEEGRKESVKQECRGKIRVMPEKEG